MTMLTKCFVSQRPTNIHSNSTRSCGCENKSTRFRKNVTLPFLSNYRFLFPFNPRFSPRKSPVLAYFFCKLREKKNTVMIRFSALLQISARLSNQRPPPPSKVFLLISAPIGAPAIMLSSPIPIL